MAMTPEERLKARRETYHRYRLRHAEKIKAHKNPEKARENARRYQEKHPERIKARKKAYRLANSEKTSAYSRKYHEAHAEDRNRKSQAWRAANHEKVCAYNKAYREAHKAEIALQDQVWRTLHAEELRLARQAAYQKDLETSRERGRIQAKARRQANPERERQRVRQYKAQKKHAPINDLSAAQWKEIKAAFGYRCVYCHRKMARLTQDHVTPYKHQGSNTLWNVVPACASCNSKKHTGPPLKPVQPLLLTIAPSRKKKTS